MGCKRLSCSWHRLLASSIFLEGAIIAGAISGG
ncbi:unnamed protein product [Acanthoscelides obtectus]|uniref:Uncharacterized protein n=1 Tax=Acanthoscelides obtectus TaxID=200917 RepID=A0A9P0LA06_ACAOB|nr:unnamed protein product [Acanthoscelides obtectus]CAK1620451.1 hypothetical protein AOBTE_LOCUS381 [Acanthoscelides obtectus]